MKIRIDLEELYKIDEARPRRPADELLKSVLDHYQLKPDLVVNISPDVGISPAHIKSESEIEEMEKKARITVELFDGYETAIAFIF